MNMPNYKMRELCVKALHDRGVELLDIAECVMFLQAKYIEDLKVDDCLLAIERVLEKNEVQHAILTGIALDVMTEKKEIIFPELQTMLENDEGLYGVDEVVAYGICNLYGSIALTNFGYIDKAKIGIIAKLNDHTSNPDTCNTFLDDIVGAVAASAASRIAHGGKRLNID